MPMFDLLNKIRANEKGDTIVEFAAAVPLMLLLFIGFAELGRAFLQANAIEKGMRAGAVYAARIDNPTEIASKTVIENLVKTGTLDGSGAYLASGWANSSSSLDVAQSYYNLNGDNVPVIRLSASVQFDPILPGLLDVIGMAGFSINLSHEQAYVDH
ncbi:hypothetical protein MTBPR1_120028 [Candidatus Terasakiella magnetica]|uniref:TadE-like domain-containing protein n=1 Tax=Candidatus Terasakiella magnetica TaxID=1867952 RepID=A0A1C3REQ3_9PROT|nr:TadE/TadG family type IV pilus assembly protein [Candidatus Terasakiella magnetica]SCA55722.1 hypothetical protein MTBPR1_120028 [Candidatus Terasakiella magnetica]